MNLPDLAIINFSDLSDAELQRVIRAVNRQIVEDFMPIWGCGYHCKLHAPQFDPREQDTVSIGEERIQAEAVIYVVTEATIPGALGYHDMNAGEVPIGFVFTELGDWTITLSHEVLELIIDPTVNIFVPGPDPRYPGDPNRWLFHSYEVCDAVERTVYEIDHVPLSNFVTPSYFRERNAPGTRNDFLGVGVDSFGVTEGSHLGVVDPRTWQWDMILGSGAAPNRGAVSRRFNEFCKVETRMLAPEKLTAQHNGIDRYRRSAARADGCLQQLPGLTRRERYADRALQMQRSISTGSGNPGTGKR